MFSTIHCKGPFRAIWVAAYFHNKLKKTQIVQTDIVSTVDNMLQGDFGVITYRVLAYLLLGVVRIHSKKVGYMYDDCQEVLKEIREFISRKHASHADTVHVPYNSITLPVRFELDAFDLDIIEDSSRSNVISKEAITLKDTAWEKPEMMQFSCFFDDVPPDENFLSTYMMDNDMEAGKSALVEVDQNHDDGKSINVSQMADLEAQCSTEMGAGELGDRGFSPEDCLNHETFTTGFHENPPDLAKPFGKDCLTIKIPEVTLLESDMPQVIEDDANLKNVLASTEKLQNVTFSHEESHKPEIFGRAEEEEPPETILQHDKEKHNIDAPRVKDMDMASSEDVRCQNNTEDQPSSFTPDVTPKSKFSDPSARTTPAFMVLPTPTSMKSIQKRKRKCIIDDPVVLSNQVMKKNLEDASDLVSKRRKVRDKLLGDKLLAAQKDYTISRLPYSFLEPLLNCSAVELRLLVCANKLEIPTRMKFKKATEEFPESDQTVEPPATISESAEALEKVLDHVETSDTTRQPNVSVSPLNCGSTEEPQIAPKTPAQQPSSVRFIEEPEIAPETPVRQTSSVRSFGSFKETHLNYDEVRPASLCLSTENDSASDEDHELNINLIDEAISSRCEDNDKQDVSPGKTRIAGILKRRNVEEMVNLSRLLKGKTKKYSAQLFYEILVLKSGGYVDVKQDCAYGDIRFRKLPTWERTDGARRKLEV